MTDMDRFERELNRMRKYLLAKYGVRPDGGERRVIIISGGIMPEPVFATADGQELFRNYPDEPLQDFCDRCMTWARELEARGVLIGGLPNSRAQSEAMATAHAWWLKHEYDEVPPEEGSNYTPPANVSPLARAIAKRAEQ
jgi:hypothetical protein